MKSSDAEQDWTKSSEIGSGFPFLDILDYFGTCAVSFNILQYRNIDWDAECGFAAGLVGGIGLRNNDSNDLKCLWLEGPALTIKTYDKTIEDNGRPLHTFLALQETLTFWGAYREGPKASESY